MIGRSVGLALGVIAVLIAMSWLSGWLERRWDQRRSRERANSANDETIVGVATREAWGMEPSVLASLRTPLAPDPSASYDIHGTITGRVNTQAPDNITPATRLASHSGESPMQASRQQQYIETARAMGPLTPGSLRLLAEGKWTISGVTAERLKLLATKLENFNRLTSAPGAIAELIGHLSSVAGQEGVFLRISSQDAERYHAALLQEGDETIESLTAAGLKAVDLSNEVFDLRQYNRVLERTIANLAEDLERKPDEPLTLRFVYGELSGEGITADMASDLALAMSFDSITEESDVVALKRAAV